MKNIAILGNKDAVMYVAESLTDNSVYSCYGVAVGLDKVLMGKGLGRLCRSALQKFRKIKIKNKIIKMLPNCSRVSFVRAPEDKTDIHQEDFFNAAKDLKKADIFLVVNDDTPPPTRIKQNLRLCLRSFETRNFQRKNIYSSRYIM